MPRAGLPTNYNDTRARAAECIRRAHVAGVSLQEVQFPAVSNQNTAALNELLDANRMHARVMLTRLRTTLNVGVGGSSRGGVELLALFPDTGEAKLAARAWRDEAPCPVSALDNPTRPANLAFCVNPGFNVSEWFSLRAVAKDDTTTVVLNGDLDRVRSGYYPRIFYPRLYDLRTKWLVKFEPVFYLKPLADGGALLREYPGNWELYYRPLGAKASNGVAPPSPEPEVLWQGEQRPIFQEAQSLLRQARIKDQLARRTT